ncbi:N-acetyllactosaminide beta-1,3-N-acetylglucosaminyltransferase, partial [Reticulomyxa filosa]
YSQKDGITIVTQCSLDRLPLIKAMCEQWQGAISLAIYIKKEELKTFLQNYTANMDDNWKPHKVAKHLEKKGTEIFAEIVKFWNGIEYGNQGDYAALDIHLLFEIEHDSDTCVEDNAGPVRVMYPVNALRNLALRYAKSDYVFLLDADFVPSSNMHALVLSMLRRKPYLVSPKIAFVVPAWE